MWVSKLLVVVVFTLVSAPLSSAVFVDRLDLPAPSIEGAENSQLFDVIDTGKRLIAVGARGVIIVSEDGGDTWKQVPVPVSSDLLAIDFPAPRYGWVVGHDGVILHSEDGGLSWKKQFDGNMAQGQLASYFDRVKNLEDPIREFFVEDVELNYANGPEQALLDVYFDDKRSGYAVGSFGTVFFTDDGGKTWEFWIDRVDSKQLLHLNDIEKVGDDLFIASEQGLVFKLNAEANRFLPLETGYHGTFFNITGAGKEVIAFGLKGAAYLSENGGNSWEKIPFPDTIVADAEVMNQKLFLLSRTGDLFVSSSLKSGFEEFASGGSSASAGLAGVGSSLVTVGRGGIRIIDDQDKYK